MTLEGEDTSATFTSIAVHTVLNRTLVHLNTSTLTMLSLWVDGQVGKLVGEFVCVCVWHQISKVLGKKVHQRERGGEHLVIKLPHYQGQESKGLPTKTAGYIHRLPNQIQMTCCNRSSWVLKETDFWLQQIVLERMKCIVFCSEPKITRLVITLIRQNSDLSFEPSFVRSLQL